MTVKLTSNARTAEEFKVELVDLLIAKAIGADTFAMTCVMMPTKLLWQRKAEEYRQLAHEIQAIKIVTEG